MVINQRKVAIIGTGHVGSHCAFSLVTQGACDSLLLIDVDKKKAEGHAVDLSDALSYLPQNIKINHGELEDCKDADVVVISVGPLIDDNENRLDSLDVTSKIVKSIVKPVVDSGFNGFFIVISNPVDIITYYVWKLSGFSKNRVIGTGTTLDSSRLRRILSVETGIDPKSIQGYTMGEHGDSQMVPWSHVYIGGKPLLELIREKKDTYGNIDLDGVLTKVVKRGWDIVLGKGCTEFGIGTSLTEIVKTIFHDDKKILPVSVLLEGEYGQHDVYASVPTILGKNGVDGIVSINLTSEEKEKFNESCCVLKEHINKINY